MSECEWFTRYDNYGWEYIYCKRPATHVNHCDQSTQQKNGEEVVCPVGARVCVDHGCQHALTFEQYAVDQETPNHWFAL